jgi:hypothetical protein
MRNPFRYFNSSPEVIRLTVMMYIRYPHECSRWLNNRAENSHQPFRRRERAMAKLRSMKTLQKFAAAHASIHTHFNHDRHLNRRDIFKQNRSAALAEWRKLGSRRATRRLKSIVANVSPLGNSSGTHGYRPLTSPWRLNRLMSAIGTLQTPMLEPSSSAKRHKPDMLKRRSEVR